MRVLKRFLGVQESSELDASLQENSKLRMLSTLRKFGESLGNTREFQIKCELSQKILTILRACIIKDVVYSERV